MKELANNQQLKTCLKQINWHFENDAYGWNFFMRFISQRVHILDLYLPIFFEKKNPIVIGIVLGKYMLTLINRQHGIIFRFLVLYN
jgi:hypothetical protein